jgi:hypothetical protein
MLYSPFFCFLCHLVFRRSITHSEHLFLSIFDAMFSRHDFIPILPQASRAKLWGFSHFAGWTLGLF